MTATATTTRTTPKRRFRLWAGAIGVVSAIVALAIGEILAVLIAPASSAILAMGSLVIDSVPPWVKDLVIDLFGTADKIVLIASLIFGVLVLAVIVGLLEYKRRFWGVVGLGVIGLLAVIAVVTRAQASPFWAIPTIVGIVVAAFVLRQLIIRLQRWVADAALTDEGETAAVSRRKFMVFLGSTAAGAILLGIGARAINSGTTAVNAVRSALKLPAPETPAEDIPAGADLNVEGGSSLITSNADFYRIDTALQVPNVDPATWELLITGMVDEEVRIGFNELLELPLSEKIITLACVSNPVGGDLIGNATWLGYPIHKLLERAKPQKGADMVLSRSVDGFTASSPLDVLMDKNRDSLLAVGMNGEPLPPEHGFPVRMIVPGLYGYVSATKWVVEMKVTRFDQDRAYWTDRSWSERGPIKTQSRIDVPRGGAPLTAGATQIAGMAWAQHTGIAKVEVRVDKGDWQVARLSNPISLDTWVQWVLDWDATPGQHQIEVRATDLDGNTQGEQRVDTVPNGAEGWHNLRVAVN